jgi:hypothetical protein
LGLILLALSFLSIFLGLGLRTFDLGIICIYDDTGQISITLFSTESSPSI